MKQNTLKPSKQAAIYYHTCKKTMSTLVSFIWNVYNLNNRLSVCLSVCPAYPLDRQERRQWNLGFKCPWHCHSVIYTSAKTLPVIIRTTAWHGNIVFFFFFYFCHSTCARQSNFIDLNSMVGHWATTFNISC